MGSPSQQASPSSNVMTPRAFVQSHARSQGSFRGCSRIGDYEMMGKLGEGTFGEVHRARSKRTGAVFALKKILMHNEKDGFPITALREIKLLKLLSHPNVLKLEEMAVEHHQKTGDKKKRSVMYMVTPYMDHDLSGLLENPSVTIVEPQIKCYMLQLLEGVRYLHDNHILHRDMKAANLLINNKGILQIADFGLARHYDEPVPVAGHGSGEARRDYTTLVVTRWYRPPELLLQLRKYTPAIDLWGVGCVFGEMIVGKPILAGESDGHQLKLIFDLVGSPTPESMPGWQSLPGAEALNSNLPPRPSTLASRFRSAGPAAVSLLSELLKLDWRKRINAIDALEHPYFKTSPLPAQPSDLPSFEESHELDRRKFRSQQAAPPPAPKGGTVGMGQAGNWGPDQATNGDSYGAYRHQNGSRYPPQGAYRNGIPPPPPEEQRRPAWSRHRDDRRDDRPDIRLPPRPPPPGGDYDSRDLSEGYRRSRSRDMDRGPPPLSWNRNSGPSNIDTYIPSYDGARSREHGRDDRDRDREPHPRDRRRDDLDGRRYDRGRDRGPSLEYGEERRRTRSRSPVPISMDRDRDRGDRYRDRDRDRDRERERDGPLGRRDMEHEREKEREIYRR